MPWGSKLLGNYAKQAMNAGHMNRAMAATGLRDVMTGMKEGYSSAARGTTYGSLGGAAAGGMWGMASDDTSVLGGMLMGATGGALGGRYMGASLSRKANRGFLSSMMGQARADYRAVSRAIGGQPVARKRPAEKSSNVHAAQAQARASTASGGPTLAGNQPVNPTAGRQRRVPPGIRRMEAMNDPAFSNILGRRGGAGLLSRTNAKSLDLRERVMSNIAQSQAARRARSGMVTLDEQRMYANAMGLRTGF